MNIKHLSHEGIDYNQFTVTELIDAGVPRSNVLFAVKKECFERIKILHASAMEELTSFPSVAMRDTWPRKAGHAEKHREAIAKATAENETYPEDSPERVDTTTEGFGLSPELIAKIETALKPGETVNSYLARVLVEVDAGDALLYSAEGFMRQTKHAVQVVADNDGTPEQIGEIMQAATAELDAKKAAFKALRAGK